MESTWLALEAPNETVKGLEGKDYEVLDIDMINMYRTELSKLVRGNFKVSRLVPDGKDVKQVYYVDNEGKLVKVPFKQILASDGGYIVAFDMPRCRFTTMLSSTLTTSQQSQKSR